MPFGDVLAPLMPTSLEQTGVDPGLLMDLLVKIGSTTPTFRSEWAADQLCLPLQLINEICWQLKEDRLVEIQGQLGPFSFKYSITGRGREQADRLFEISGYLGPAPVSLSAYTAMLDWHFGHWPEATEAAVRAALASLVLAPDAVDVAALAALSGRSLFLFGPPGNGKSSVGRTIHSAFHGELWIPYCLCVDNSIVRIFDPQIHNEIEVDEKLAGKIDRRWIRIRRPFVVAGGEMTIDSLDLAYSPSLRFYEAPMHMKANGGTFLIDDFGRQRIEPHVLLNRWIVPLEHRVDHLTLHTGQKLQVPFRLMLIVATNLSVSAIADPAFLRRMGYRLHLDFPDAAMYSRIFRNYAAASGVAVADRLIESLVARYQQEKRKLRASEPRDLIERAKDVCRLRKVPLELTEAVMALAWTGYFGNHPTEE